MHTHTHVHTHARTHLPKSFFFHYWQFTVIMSWLCKTLYWLHQVQRCLLFYSSLGMLVIVMKWNNVLWYIRVSPIDTKIAARTTFTPRLSLLSEYIVTCSVHKENVTGTCIYSILYSKKLWREKTLAFAKLLSVKFLCHLKKLRAAFTLPIFSAKAI